MPAGPPGLIPGLHGDHQPALRAQPAGLRYLAFRVFGSVVTILSVYAVSFRRRFVVVALVLAIPAMVQRIIVPRADAGALAVISIVLTFVFDVYVVVVIFRRVFMKDKPTTEAVFGALCIYLLVGFGFSSLYGMLATVQPHAFYLDPAKAKRFEPHLARDAQNFGGQVERRGAVTVVWTRPPTGDLRNSVQACAFG